MEQPVQMERKREPMLQRKQATAKQNSGTNRGNATASSTATFCELQSILHEMRPYTLQVLKTPYYRNCKAARNMRRGMRHIRDLCKQIRIETVSLGKRNKGTGTRRRRRPVQKPPAVEEEEEEEEGAKTPEGGSENNIKSSYEAAESADGIKSTPGSENMPSSYNADESRDVESSRDMKQERH